MIDVNFRCRTATEHDFETLAGIRISAMRESLEQVNRFDPDRARRRLKDSFQPTNTKILLVEDEPIGFVAIERHLKHITLHHLYVLPNEQGRGIDSRVLSDVLSDADSNGLPVHVTALKESVSNRIYQRAGFKLRTSDEYDNHYVRPVYRPEKQQ